MRGSSCIRVDFRLPQRANEPVIVISNHQSTLDILVLASLLYRSGWTNVRWIVKQQLRHAPVVGLVAKEMECAFVSRDGNPRDGQSVIMCARLADADNGSVMLFPEGTRFTGNTNKDGFRHVLPPKPKGFQILCNELPSCSILSITLRWHPPIGIGRGKTMFHGADFYRKLLTVTAAIVRHEVVTENPEWLQSEWERKDSYLATA